MDAPTEAPADQSETLNKLELELRSEDCVMEPGVLDTITRYIKAAGKPTDAIENLTSHYVGAHEDAVQNMTCKSLGALAYAVESVKSSYRLTLWPRPGPQAPCAASPPFNRIQSPGCAVPDREPGHVPLSDALIKYQSFSL